MLSKAKKQKKQDYSYTNSVKYLGQDLRWHRGEEKGFKVCRLRGTVMLATYFPRALKFSTSVGWKTSIDTVLKVCDSGEMWATSMIT